MRPGFLATRRARTVALVFALNGFLFANWFARIPAVKAELGLSDAALGLALLGLPVGALAVMSVTGWIVARLGAGRVTLVASALFCLSVPLPALATDALTLAMALTALGAANGAMDIAMNAEAALVEQDAGRSILIGFHAMYSLGGAAGALAGGLATLVATPLPHLATVGLAGAALLALRRNTLPDQVPPGAAGPVFALPSGPLLPLAILVFVVMLAEGAAADWSAVYLRQTLGTTEAIAALGFAAFATGMTLGRLAGDRLNDRWGERRLVMGGLVAAALALALGLALGRPALTIAGFAVLGLGVAASVPICFREAVRQGGSQGLAAVATVGYTGLLAGPAAIGLLAEAIGLGLALALVPALLLLVSGIARASFAAPSPALPVRAIER